MKLKKNMSLIDRLLRGIIVALVAILYFTGTISGTMAWVLGVLAAVFLLTSLFGFCPLYLPFNFSTKK